VTPALFSSFCVAVLELLAAVEPIFGVAPEVGPLPASTVPGVISFERPGARWTSPPFHSANAGIQRLKRP
jgi:hypothetical protein